MVESGKRPLVDEALKKLKRGALRESVLRVLRGRFKKVSSATERRVAQVSARELPGLIERAATVKRGEALFG